MENLAPAKLNHRISGLKKISNNRVVVETTTKEEMDRVLKNENLQAAGRVSGLLTKKRPMLIVHDVPAQLDEEEFLTERGDHDGILETIRNRRVFPTRRANGTLHSTSRQNPTRNLRSGNYLVPGSKCQLYHVGRPQRNHKCKRRKAGMFHTAEQAPL